MTVLDWVIVLCIGIGFLYGFIDGFIKQLASVVGLVIGFCFARALYEVAANIYCTRTIENETYIFGFSKQGSEVVMDLYSAGEHSSMMKREDGSEVSSNVETPTEATVAQNANDSGKYGDYNLHVYEGSYSDFPESLPAFCSQNIMESIQSFFCF